MARVLVVEDEKEFSELLGTFLTMSGHDAVVVQSVEGALSTQGPFDLAIVDWTLPDGAAVDAIQAVRERSPSCGVLVMSGHHRSMLEGLPQDCGFVQKPFRLVSLREIVAGYV